MTEHSRKASVVWTVNQEALEMCGEARLVATVARQGADNDRYAELLEEVPGSGEWTVWVGEGPDHLGYLAGDLIVGTLPTKFGLPTAMERASRWMREERSSND